MSSHPSFSAVRVIDSHTEGEPTRVVIEGGPELGTGPLSERRRVFSERFDPFRSAVCNEPRGSDAMVGAVLVPPVNPKAVTGVIFFNNVGYLNMCVHGTIGLGATLAHLGRIGPGSHVVETPVGDVTMTLGMGEEADEEGGAEGRSVEVGEGSHAPERGRSGSRGNAMFWNPNRVAVANVPSFRYRKHVPVTLDDGRTVHGDIAWGGNWFFLVDDHGEQLSMRRLESLTDLAWRIRLALERDHITGDSAFGGGEIDHIELFGPPTRADCQSKNFVLCPGKAYDRSPCGTGTSAKLACLHADGKLASGQVWRQESIIGTAFSGRVERSEMRVPSGASAAVLPIVTGEAYITAEATLIMDANDPLRDGIRMTAH